MWPNFSKLDLFNLFLLWLALPFAFGLAICFFTVFPKTDFMAGFPKPDFMAGFPKPDFIVFIAFFGPIVAIWNQKKIRNKLEPNVYWKK